MAHEQSPPSGLVIRDGRDSDSEQLITLIESVYAEYPGCVLDVDGEAPHLRSRERLRQVEWRPVGGGVEWPARRLRRLRRP